MKRTLMIFGFIIVIILTACTPKESAENLFFDENGNLKEEYAETMEKEWCEHNKDRDFAIDRCKNEETS